MKKSNRVISMALALALSVGTILSTTAPVNAAGVRTVTPVVVKHTATKVDKNSTLNYVLSQPPSLDSTLATDDQSFEIIGNTMECLARQDYKGSTVVNAPGAATKWQVTPDGKTWTFYIRNMKWSDGKAVTAKDFEYSWLRLLNPSHGSEYAYFLYMVKGGEAYNKKKGSASSVGIRALSQTKFQVILNNATPHFEKLLSFPILAPIRADVANKLGDKYGTCSSVSKMVWCGPYMVTSWKLGQSLTLKKNPKYWDAANVKLSTINFTLADMEIATRIQLFENKKLDQTGASGDWIQKLKAEAAKGKFTYLPDSSLSSFYLTFNCKDKVFKNAKIRKAFGMAVDRNIWTKVLHKRYIPSYSLVPKKITCGSKDFRTASGSEPLKDLMKVYPTAASWKNLLVAGMKEAKLGTSPASLQVEYLTYGSDSLTKMEAEFLQNQWQSKLGVKVSIKSVADWGQFLKATNSGDYQVSLNGWNPDYNDPMTYLDMWTTGNGLNKAKYSNAAYDKLISQAQTMTNEAKRLSLLKQAERKLIYEDGVLAPLFVMDYHRFLQKYVKGVQFFDMGAQMDFKYAYTSGR